MVTPQTIVFIHGLFQNPKSWEKWQKYFEQQGFKCFTPAYPFHEGEPDILRKNIDSNLRGITLRKVVGSVAHIIDTLPEKPILIGHSMGGLVVQKLISMNKGAAGICIDSAPPAGIFSFEWSFLKANLPTINPLKGNSVFLPSVQWFHYAFCNTMTLEQTQVEYDKYVVPESRNIARSSTGKDGKIDFSKPHRPLLFIAGEKDHIIPASLNEKNYHAYRDKRSKREFKSFPDRTHYICGQENWEEVASYVERWILNLK
ncbi:MAG: alpha/beta hydrolase [Flammeovirgaceae bacterium]|nr:alpha/beta hydrolase [Flammeovirgaceae bacterium]